LTASGQLNLTFVPVIAKPKSDWEGETGFINAAIMKKYLSKQYKRFMYLVCEPKPMMDAMEQALPELGVPLQNIITDSWALMVPHQVGSRGWFLLALRLNAEPAIMRLPMRRILPVCHPGLKLLTWGRNPIAWNAIKEGHPPYM
jgi:hypothetical protein